MPLEVEIEANRMAAATCSSPMARRNPGGVRALLRSGDEHRLAKELRDFAYQLAKRGFVTLAIGSPGGDARQPVTGEARCQPLSTWPTSPRTAPGPRQSARSGRRADRGRRPFVWREVGDVCRVPERPFCLRVWSDPGIAFDEKRANVNYWDPWYLGAQPGRRVRPACPTTRIRAPARIES